MVLIDAEIGSTVKFIKFMGGRGLSGKLRQLGLCPGDKIKILRRAPFTGPILVEIQEREIALGAGIAAKIEIEACL